MNFLKWTLTLIYTTFLLTAMATRNETLNCITDRDVYVSGDKIMVNAFISNESNSKTVYVDLCSFSGNHITGAKLMVENHRAQGTIQIPDSLRTGTYLLRTFYNQDHQRKLHIRDLLIANRFEDFSNNFTGQLKKMDSPSIDEEAGIKITVPDTLNRRGKYALKLVLKQDLTDQLEGGVSISVSKYNNSFKSAENYFNGLIASNESSVGENDGLIISGKVIDKISQLPVTDALVYISTSDSIPGFQYCTTGRDGAFHFLMKNIYGTLPVVIQATKENEDDQLKIVLDEKFNFMLPQFPVTTIEKDNMMAEELKMSTEVFTFDKIFNDQPPASRSTAKTSDNTLLFYGEPTYTIRPDEFYNLPDFSEVSRELLVGVKFRDKNNKRSLNLIDADVNQYFDEQAFLLVDGVPVQDLTLIKDLGSADISWIHTVLEYRFFGDIHFPGVVSIHTRHAGLNWLKESDRLIKHDFEGLQQKETITEVKVPGTYPDLRPVLLWEPNCAPSPSMEIEFKSSDIAGDYFIKVTGKKKNGEMIQSSRIIHIN
ncbi:MAG: hypothetical protein ACM3P1_08800 [Candidatus Saccharibacteria bacterium]